MALGFPNHSRSYDPKWGRVRFWGNDGALEVSFLLEIDALMKLCPGLPAAEAGLLDAFDRVRDRINSAASQRYSARDRRFVYILTATDFP
jgi:hypothetical protein